MEPPPKDKLVNHGDVRSESYPRPRDDSHSDVLANLHSTTLSSSASAMAAPPVARKEPHKLKEHGDERVDNYHWLRDESIISPRDYWLGLVSEYPALANDKRLLDALLCASKSKALAHLRDENKYTDAVMSDVKELEDELYNEIRGRINKVGIVDAPVRKGEYYYYEKTLAGKEYVQHCRRHVPNDGPITVHDVMPTGPDAPEEHIILDENVLAEGHGYYKIGAFKVSPDNKLVAYAEDTKGGEIYTVYIIDAQSGSYVEQPLQGITSDIEWVGDDHLVYITMDRILRPDKVKPNNKLVDTEDIEGDEIHIGEYDGQPLEENTRYEWCDKNVDYKVYTEKCNKTLRSHKVMLHQIGTGQPKDICLHHEKDEKFSLDFKVSESKRYVFVYSTSKNTKFVFYIDTLSPAKGLSVLTRRVDGTGATASHRGKHFFINRWSDNSYNSELVACPLDNVDETIILLPHRESVKIQDFRLFQRHIAVYERENGLPRVTVYRLPAIQEPIGQLQRGRTIHFTKTIPFVDPIFAVYLEESYFHSCILRFRYSSMRTPSYIIDYDMESEVQSNKPVEVLNGFDASNYGTERKWAPAADGTKIPMSILYRKDLRKLDGSGPMLLYGYGSYEDCNDPRFRASIFSLVDRGFIYAIAHIRGGGEMGRKWYKDGKLLKKKNTFTDFIACAEHLIENKYCSKEKLCISGRSAGGLLMGAVLNMRPDLFKAAIVKVPFVDVLTTMLDPTIRLTTIEWEEWGDPREKEYYDYMKSYSPVDNVTAQKYPNILVTAGLLDTCVQYFEPAKFVAKLRELKTDDNLLLFKCDFHAGHFKKGDEELKEDAFIYTFILKALGMTRSQRGLAIRDLAN